MMTVGPAITAHSSLDLKQEIQIQIQMIVAPIVLVSVPYATQTLEDGLVIALRPQTPKHIRVG
jgi:hypothetical protein